nr:hypothetical protein [Tanacetum cinerariifolium]
PVGTKLYADSFYISKDMDSETLHKINVPKWNVLNESALDDPDMCRSLVDHLSLVLFSYLRGMDYDQLFAEFNIRDARQTYIGTKVRMRLEHTLREKKKFEGRLIRQVDLLKEKDAEVASLKAQLSLKEAEATEAIRLSLEDEKNGLEHTVAALKSVDAAKVTELASLTAQTAKLTQELSELGLSCDELSIKASSLEVERDRLVGQVSMLEGTCFELRDEVSGYKLFKE